MLRLRTMGRGLIWILPRMDDYDAWVCHNPVLAKDEVGVIADYGMVYIGDGKTPVNQLPPSTVEEVGRMYCARGAYDG